MTWLLGPTGQVWCTCEFDFPGDCFDMYLVSINLTIDFQPTDHENLIIFLFIDILYAVIRLTSCTKYEFHECFFLHQNLFEWVCWYFSIFFILCSELLLFLVIIICKPCMEMCGQIKSIIPLSYKGEHCSSWAQLPSEPPPLPPPIPKSL